MSLDAARAMALGARKALGSDVGLATTGVAGPDPQDGLEPGTVFVGVAFPDRDPFARQLQLFGGRGRVREMGTISSLDVLRHHLIERSRLL